MIVFFIIVCTAATLYASGHRNIADAAEAARALVPLAGKWAGAAVCVRAVERVAFRGVDSAAFDGARDLRGAGIRGGHRHKFREAPIFYWLYTVLIVVGAGIDSAAECAAVEDPDVFAGGQRHLAAGRGDFHMLLINRRDLMGEYVNTPDVQRGGLGDQRLP